MRIFCLSRVARFPDPGVLGPASAALANQVALLAEEHRNYDEAEHWAAALAATSAGSTAGLTLIVERADEDWAEEGEAMRAALHGARGAEATAAVADLLDGADRRATVAGLRVLAACGSSEEAVPVVKPLLKPQAKAVGVKKKKEAMKVKKER